MKLFKRPDIIIVLLIALVGSVWLFLRAGEKQAATLTVYVDGEVWEQRSLSKETPHFVLKPPSEPPVVIEGEGTQAWFSSAGCRNQLCVNAGRVGGLALSAACLPASVVLVVEGAENTAKMDTITY
ncbi:MAG: NusG domain II-containing protein [Clostridium sp.]|jgi:hypothetical protein|nr:NusG domain II-containing protein [Clostridium sp.]